MLRNLIRLGVASGLVWGGVVVASPETAHARTLVSCSGMNSIVTFNPTLKSQDARWVNADMRRSDGTKSFWFGSPIAADNQTCFVDGGIRINNFFQDSRYRLDDQTNGNAVLTAQLGVGRLIGSDTCDISGNADASFPTAYPLQGQIVWRFNQLDASLRPIESRQYIRLDKDPSAGAGFYSVRGIAIRGPGLGGDVTAEVSLLPTNHASNVNFADCVSGGPSASLREQVLQQADSLDADNIPDTWDISIP